MHQTVDTHISISISPLFFGVLAFGLLYDPNAVGVGCLLASLLHETGHLLMIVWRGGRVKSICIGAFGMRIERELSLHLSFWDDVCIASGGPLMNLLWVGVCWLCGWETMCGIHMLLMLLNLLPIEALDGGEILRCILYRFLKRETVRIVLLVCSLAVVFPLGVLGFGVLIQSGYNPTLLIVDIYLILLLIFKRKD